MSGVVTVSRALTPRNWTSTSDPTNGWDAADGVLVGDHWYNTTSQQIFVCVSNAVGAARWRHLPSVWQAGGASHTGSTSETTLATVSIPAGAMGANGRLSIEALWGATNNANNKTSRIRFSGGAGTEFFTLTTASYATFSIEKIIHNLTASSQIGGISGNGTAGGYGVVTGATVSSSVDTSAATTLLFTGQLATGTDTINLHAFKVTLTRPDIT